MLIKYHSWIPSQLGVEEEMLEVSSDITLNAVLDLLADKSPAHKRIFTQKNVIYGSRDGAVLEHNAILGPQNTILLFSPISGG